MKLSRGKLFPGSKDFQKDESSYDGVNRNGPVFKYEILKKLHKLFLPVACGPASNKLVADFQDLCGLNLDGSASNKILKYLFTTASIAGEEIYSLMPVLMWSCIDIGIPFMTNFGVMLLFGQLTKDWLSLPRPPSNWKGCRRPIIKLEKHFETEFGFPSTHTMSGLMPLVVALALYRQGYEVTDNAWMGCALYAVTVALSRLYMGVHSLLDIVGGFCIGLLFVFGLHIVGDTFEHIVYFQGYSILISLLTLVPYLFCYPKTAPWSAAYGTSTQFYGTWLGGAVSFWYAKVANPRVYRILQSISVLRLGSESHILIFKHFVVGMVLIAINKVVVKFLATKLLVKLRRLGVIKGVPEEEVDAFGTSIPESKLYVIEVPVRILNYGLLAFGAIVGSPLVFEWLKLLPQDAKV